MRGMARFLLVSFFALAMTDPGEYAKQDGTLVAQAKKKKKAAGKAKAKPGKKPAAKTPEPEPLEAPAPEPAATPAAGTEAKTALSGGRVEFDAQLIKGQTTKAGEVQILERKDTELKSMVKRRTSFREEIIRTVFPEM